MCRQELCPARALARPRATHRTNKIIDLALSIHSPSVRSGLAMWIPLQFLSLLVSLVRTDDLIDLLVHVRDLGPRRRLNIHGFQQQNGADPYKLIVAGERRISVGLSANLETPRGS